MGSSIAYYPHGCNWLRVGQGPTQNLCYDRQPEGDIYLPALGCLGVEVQRVIVVSDLVPRLGLGAKVFGAPDPRFIAILEQASQNLGRQRSPFQRAHPSQQLDVVE